MLVALFVQVYLLLDLCGVVVSLCVRDVTLDGTTVTLRSWFCAEPPHRSGCLTILNTVIWDKLMSWSPKVWNRQVLHRSTRKNILIWRISIKLISDVLRAVVEYAACLGSLSPYCLMVLVLSEWHTAYWNSLLCFYSSFVNVTAAIYWL